MMFTRIIIIVIVDHLDIDHDIITGYMNRNM